MLKNFLALLKTRIFSNKYKHNDINPLNAELNSICHLLALLGAHPILHVSRIRVKKSQDNNGNNEIISQWPSDSAYCTTQ
jgi:hypothetical protein